MDLARNTANHRTLISWGKETELMRLSGRGLYYPEAIEVSHRTVKTKKVIN